MTTKLQKLLQKRMRTVIGLLSGTSVDGVDAVLMKITGSGKSTSIKVIDFITHPIPEKMRYSVFRNSDNKTASIEEIARLNVILGAVFADAVHKILKRNSLKTSNIDLIGSHGQTIPHPPGKEDFLGYRMKSTLQIGDPSVIANLTGITTVGDFRIADCAVDGDGAPLVPYLDHLLFSDKRKSRGLLNIGGISNVTILPKNSPLSSVFAFDTGPGNMLIDGLMYHLYHKKYDKDARIAKKGTVVPKLFEWLLQDTVYRQQPPKSTGREHYGQHFQKKLLKAVKGLNPADVIRTVTEFTSYSIWFNYKNFIESRCRIDELIVSGGGAENPLITSTLSNYFKGIKVTHLKQFGVTTQNKEAVLFAVLGNECLAGNPANMRSVTGSIKSVILGKICQA
ncbi:MAG TPA: anhydro-N-acetylmuramic acid kinase [Ignavibacteria bacterium]|nr:anhydro-N-acetylmuramic acid kinase [Ignavibacteria bacterium]